MSIVVKGMAPLLQVFDMPAAIAFYRDKSGFEVVNSNAPGRRLRLGPCSRLAKKS